MGRQMGTARDRDHARRSGRGGSAARRWCVGAAFFVAAGLGQPAVSAACSGPAYWFTLLGPAPGATEVPLDAVVTLTYVNPSAPVGDLGLRLLADGVGAVDIAVFTEPWAHSWIHRVVVVPQEPLLAGRVHRLQVGDTLLGRFTSGDVADDVPPAPPTLLSVEATSARDSETSCGDYSVRPIAIRVSSEEPVTYVVRAAGVLLAEQHLEQGCGQSCGALLGDIVCDGRRWDDSSGQRWELPPGSHTLQITARDLAGNESSPIEVEVAAACPSGGCTAAPDPRPLGVLGALLWLGALRRRAAIAGAAT